MQSKPCNAILPLKSPITEDESNDVMKNTLDCVSQIVTESLEDITKNKKKKNKKEDNMEEHKDLSEKEVSEFLTQDKNNIILVFGQKIYTGHRTEIKSNIKKQENIFVDDTGKKYYQIIGRHLIDEDDIKSIINKDLSIFNISTLKNVIRVTNKTSPLKHSRSVYSVDPYTKEEYSEMINE
jgi:hypothetical protein